MHYKLRLTKTIAAVLMTLSILVSPLFVPLNQVEAETLEEQLERLEQELN